MALADLYSGPLYLGGNPEGDAADYFRKTGMLKPPTVLGRPAPSPVNAEAPNMPTPNLGSSTMLGGQQSTQIRNPLQDQAPQPLTGKHKALAAIFAGMGAFRSPELGQQIYNEEFVAPQERYQKQQEQQQADIAQQREAASRESLQGAQAQEAQARANALNNPPEKDVKQDWRPVTGTNWEINSATGETRQMQGVPTPPPKEPAAKNPMSGTVNGKQAYAYPASDGNGFVDANTGARLRNFVPAPSFAETGLYEPTEVPTPGGGMAPAVFNRRSGTVTRTNPQNAPIPAAAQKEINSDLASARNMDRLESAQQDILDEATKRGQRGPMGGGPYLNGPESMQFVSNHIAMTFGGVKGARVGRDLIEAHIKARDLDQATEAAAQRVLSGGVITYQQAQQMMGTAKINRSRMWQQARQAAEQYGVPDAVKMPSDLLGGGMQGGKTKSSDGIDFQPH